ncbi:MAG: hypothetical protein SGPRY_011978 [Prymnesium sp.]
MYRIRPLQGEDHYRHYRQSDNLFNNNVTNCTFRDPCAFGTFAPLSSAPQPVIPNDQASRYIVAPESVRAIDRAMADDTISIQQRRDDYRRTTGGSGIGLLIKLSAEARHIVPKLGTATELAAQVSRGLTSATVIGFDNFRSKYTPGSTTNFPSDDEPATPCSRRYIALCAAVRHLGPMVSTRVDLKIAVTPTALNTLDKTVGLLTLIPEEEEFSSGIGQALSANR